MDTTLPSAGIGVHDLLDAGLHFGHQTKRWNPKMRQYIYGTRNGIHIIDLQQTLPLFLAAHKRVVEAVANGKDVLFVGTKKQSQTVIREEAKRCGMFFVTNRWYLVPGILLSLLTIALMLKSMPSAQTLLSTVVFGVFIFIPVFMLIVSFRRLLRGGIRGKVHFGVNLIGIVVFIAFIANSELMLENLITGVSWAAIGGILLMLLMNYFFHNWLKAPTLAGRKLLDQIEGFKHYLEVAEQDELASLHRPGGGRHALHGNRHRRRAPAGRARRNGKRRALPTWPRAVPAGFPEPGRRPRAGPEGRARSQAHDPSPERAPDRDQPGQATAARASRTLNQTTTSPVPAVSSA